MKNTHIIDIAHHLMRSYITKDDVVIDMTMGNGYDTLFLAQIAKYVYAFDIQKQALLSTQKRLDENNITNTKLILDSHEHINQYQSQYKYVIYNLGYLPNGDKSITTTSQTTLNSLKTVLKTIEEGGIVFMVIYPGHEEGKKESEQLEDFFKTIDHRFYKVVKNHLPYQHLNPPYLVMIYKKERNQLNYTL
jgi:ubiquinone/menaquinone biosynthesis C-methylase UbiE